MLRLRSRCDAPSVCAQRTQSLFANQYDSKIECERCKQTLIPLSNTLGEPIIFKYGCVVTSTLQRVQLRAVNAIPLKLAEAFTGARDLDHHCACALRLPPTHRHAAR